MAGLLSSLGYPQSRNAPMLPVALRSAARIESSGGSHEAAQRYAREAVALAESVARDPAQSADVGEALLVLGLTLRDAHDPSAARQSLDRAVVSLTNGLGAEHRLTREARTLVASLN